MADSTTLQASIQYWNNSTGDPTAAWTWNTLILDDEPVPALVKTIKCPLSRSIDKPKVKGTAGAKLKSKGEDVPHLTIELEIWGHINWVLWQDFRARHNMWPAKQGGETFVYRAEHPFLQLKNINEIYLESLDEQYPERGIMPVTLVAYQRIQYPRPAPPPEPVRYGEGLTGEENEKAYGLVADSSRNANYALEQALKG